MKVNMKLGDKGRNILYFGTEGDSGQLHTPALSPPRKELLVTTGQTSTWVQGREKIHGLDGK
jgi:hypothetical protein